MNTIKKFEDMLKADENLALEYSKMVETKDREAILDFLKTHGVSDEDIKNQELSDDELDGVAGGAIVSGTSNRTHVVTNENDRF